MYFLNAKPEANQQRIEQNKATATLNETSSQQNSKLQTKIGSFIGPNSVYSQNQRFLLPDISLDQFAKQDQSSRQKLMQSTTFSNIVNQSCKNISSDNQRNLASCKTVLASFAGKDCRNICQKNATFVYQQSLTERPNSEVNLSDLQMIKQLKIDKPKTSELNKHVQQQIPQPPGTLNQIQRQHTHQLLNQTQYPITYNQKIAQNFKVNPLQMTQNLQQPSLIIKNHYIPLKMHKRERSYQDLFNNEKLKQSNLPKVDQCIGLDYSNACGKTQSEIDVDKMVHLSRDLSQKLLLTSNQGNIIKLSSEKLLPDLINKYRDSFANLGGKSDRSQKQRVYKSQNKSQKRLTELISQEQQTISLSQCLQYSQDNNEMTQDVFNNYAVKSLESSFIDGGCKYQQSLEENLYCEDNL
eukprot:403346978